MSTRLRLAPAGTLRSTLLVEAVVASLLLLTLLLWGLLAALGDQTGAAAAKILAGTAAFGLGMLQIVLLHLLALPGGPVKMEGEAQVSRRAA